MTKGLRRVGGAVMCCAILAAAGCGGTTPTPAATHTTARRPGAPDVAAGTARRLLAATYLAIAVPANRRLDHDFDGLSDNQSAHLAAAQADLRDAAATERQFDRSLLDIAFPAGNEAIIRLLYVANQARAELSSKAAAATSLSQLQGYEKPLDAANRPVEDAVQVIRSQLGLPPPSTS